jgi:hypothetical protein
MDRAKALCRRPKRIRATVDLTAMGASERQIRFMPRQYL